jgi:hypothetical protein
MASGFCSQGGKTMSPAAVVFRMFASVLLNIAGAGLFGWNMLHSGTDKSMIVCAILCFVVAIFTMPPKPEVRDLQERLNELQKAS